LLVAMVPLMAAAIAAWLGHEKRRPRHVAGLFVGFLGVAALVGLDVQFSDWLAVLALATASLGYAVGPVIVNRKLRDAPTLGVITGSLMLATALYAPFAVFLWPAHATAGAFASVVSLGVICTATAFLIFFALIGEAGPARATVIAYVNPLVAITLGVMLLGEPLTLGMAVGFPMVIVGSVLAARG
jgi:drug/metabolite transporter (DMT)-like permease